MARPLLGARLASVAAKTVPEFTAYAKANPESAVPDYPEHQRQKWRSFHGGLY
jgi:hypothetical protein